MKTIRDLAARILLTICGILAIAVFCTVIGCSKPSTPPPSNFLQNTNWRVYSNHNPTTNKVEYPGGKWVWSYSQDTVVQDFLKYGDTISTVEKVHYSINPIDSVITYTFTSQTLYYKIDSIKGDTSYGRYTNNNKTWKFIKL